MLPLLLIGLALARGGSYLKPGELLQASYRSRPCSLSLMTKYLPSHTKPTHIPLRGGLSDEYSTQQPYLHSCLTLDFASRSTKISDWLVQQSKCCVLGFVIQQLLFQKKSQKDNGQIIPVSFVLSFKLNGCYNILGLNAF